MLPEVMVLPRAILFDMDGTLTRERIDWSALRSELNIPAHQGFLEALEQMDLAERSRVEQILHDHEHQAALRSELNDGCRELLNWLDAHGIGRALITRNTRASVQTVFELHGLHFDVTITREDGIYKPDPEPLLRACTQLKVPTEQVWMVGDWKYDIEAANAARITGIWLSYGRERTFKAVPDYTVEDLPALWRWLKQLSEHRV